MSNVKGIKFRGWSDPRNLIPTKFNPLKVKANTEKQKRDNSQRAGNRLFHPIFIKRIDPFILLTFLKIFLLFFSSINLNNVQITRHNQRIYKKLKTYNKTPTFM